MEDVGFTDDMNDQDSESVGMAEKDDADLSFQKHTGDYYSYNVKQILSAAISCCQEDVTGCNHVFFCFCQRSFELIFTNALG